MYDNKVHGPMPSTSGLQTPKNAENLTMFRESHCLGIDKKSSALVRWYAGSVAESRDAKIHQVLNKQVLQDDN